MRSLVIAMVLSFMPMIAHAITFPDELDFVKSDEPGYQTVIARWGNHTYHLKVKGKVDDPDNQTRYDEWIQKVMEMEDENSRDP